MKRPGQCHVELPELLARHLGIGPDRTAGGRLARAVCDGVTSSVQCTGSSGPPGSAKTVHPDFGRAHRVGTTHDRELEPLRLPDGHDLDGVALGLDPSGGHARPGLGVGGGLRGCLQNGEQPGDAAAATGADSWRSSTRCSRSVTRRSPSAPPSTRATTPVSHQIRENTSATGRSAEAPRPPGERLLEGGPLGVGPRRQRVGCPAHEPRAAYARTSPGSNGRSMAAEQDRTWRAASDASTFPSALTTAGTLERAAARNSSACRLVVTSTAMSARHRGDVLAPVPRWEAGVVEDVVDVPHQVGPDRSTGRFGRRVSSRSDRPMSGGASAGGGRGPGGRRSPDRAILRASAPGAGSTVSNRIAGSPNVAPEKKGVECPEHRRRRSASSCPAWPGGSTGRRRPSGTCGCRRPGTGRSPAWDRPR